ncbi:hypothetical protein MGN70_004260 [Eutypa lata]|nr:hypothetical protein MGN70_004260 [Eutypa lata]
MRFLCLHGLGSNSKVFETQTAALRYELGDHHVYEFVEGTLPAEMDPDLREVFSPVDEFFAYADFKDIPSCVAALDNLKSYLEAEGPFDAVLAFSQGASLVVSYIAQTMKRNPVAENLSPTFKCAILFAPVAALEPELLRQTTVRTLDPSVDGEVINIPTAHIWGCNDTLTDAVTISSLCASDTKEVYVHSGGHEIPGSRMNNDVKNIVRVIRRVVSMATYKQ